MPTEDLRHPKRQENFHVTLGQKEKEKEGIRMGPEPQGGSCERGKVPAPWEGSLPAEKLDWTKGEFWSLRGERTTSLWKAKWRVTCTEGQHHNPAHPNLRYSSVGEDGGRVLSPREKTRVR